MIEENCLNLNQAESTHSCQTKSTPKYSKTEPKPNLNWNKKSFVHATVYY